MALLVPHDIMYDILLKLPLKSLIRFKAVSQEWRNCITSTKFVQLHQKKSVQDSESNALLILKYGSRFYIASDFGNTLAVRPTELSLPRAFRGDPSTKIIDSCNGLLCMGSGKFLNSYFIFNPTNPREFKIIPFVKNELSTDLMARADYNISIASGFGYDHITEEYKIVYIWYWYGCGGLIYGSRLGSWKSFHVPGVGRQWTYCGVLNNFMHFVTESTAGIYQLDLSSQEWRLLDFPHIEEPHGIKNVCVLDGCLSCLVVPYNNDEYDNELWIMREYGVRESWTRALTLSFSGGCRVVFYSARLQRFLLDNEFFGLVWYDSGEEDEKEMTRVNLEGKFEISDAKVITGSLASVWSKIVSFDHKSGKNLLESQKEGDTKEAEVAESKISPTRKKSKNKKKRSQN